MGRPQDAGLIELRARSGSSALSREQRALECETSVVERGIAGKDPVRKLSRLALDRLRLDQGSDYWRGRIDLRHLHDVAQIEKQEGVDWVRLRTIIPAAFWENALATQLLSLHHFFAIALPPELTFGRMARSQHWRQTAIAAHPIAGLPLRLAGNLIWGLRRIRPGAALAKGGPSRPCSPHQPSAVGSKHWAQGLVPSFVEHGAQLAFLAL